MLPITAPLLLILQYPSIAKPLILFLSGIFLPAKVVDDPADSPRVIAAIMVNKTFERI